MSITLKVIVSLVAFGTLLMPSQEVEATEAENTHCNVVPGGVISAEMASGFSSYWPLYSQIALQEGVDPALIAPIHYREHFGRDNPKNGQGIFQLYSLVKSGAVRFPSTNGASVSDEEFVHQGRLAVRVLKGKAREYLSISPDVNLVKQVYYGYNGRNRLYASQARPGEGPWDGSPYVMNVPGVRELVMMTRDGGRGPRRLDSRPGAFPIYEELVRQCGTATPPAPLTVISPRTDSAQTSGYGFSEFIDSVISKKGTGMKEFVLDSYPMNFGGEALLLVSAFIVAIACGFLTCRVRWGCLRDVLTVTLLALTSLSMALIADSMGGGWEFEDFFLNFSALNEAIFAWVAYSERIEAIRMIILGMLIAFVIWMGIKFYKSGRSALGEIAMAFKLLIFGWFKAARYVFTRQYLWVALGSIGLLLLLASHLNTTIWTYGLTIASVCCFGLIMWIDNKSKVEAESLSQ